MKWVEWWRRVTPLAAAQNGLVTAAQALDRGASRAQLTQLVKHGVLERLSYGVYLVAGAPMDMWTDTRAAWLSLDPGRTAAQRLASTDPVGIASHETACLLHGVGNMGADRFEFVTSTRLRTRNPLVHLRTRSAGGDEWTVRQGLPVTTIPRTVSDLVRDGVDGDHLGAVVRDALVDRLTTVDELAVALDPVSSVYQATDGYMAVVHLLDLVGLRGIDLERLGFDPAVAA
ncbi:type IV toxin-antitoxin system AbiEi family antitoxin domain-containing protein [Yimella sp. cx-573]|nr:type IV toxin-antitoxin system AbiEi family antitoxin domain-containing protein [Yimella sp. cx-573]